MSERKKRHSSSKKRSSSSKRKSSSHKSKRRSSSSHKRKSSHKQSSQKRSSSRSKHKKGSSRPKQRKIYEAPLPFGNPRGLFVLVVVAVIFFFMSLFFMSLGTFPLPFLLVAVLFTVLAIRYYKKKNWEKKCPRCRAKMKINSQLLGESRPHSVQVEGGWVQVVKQQSRITRYCSKCKYADNYVQTMKKEW